MSETDLVRSILAALKRLHVRAWRTNAGTFRVGGRYIKGAPDGTPDICGVLPGTGGVGFWLEVKTQDGKLRPSQVEWHAWAQSEGVRVAVVRTTREAVEAVQAWTAERLSQEVLPL